MPLATFKDLCLDVNDQTVEIEFWGRVLGLDVVPDDSGGGFHLAGPTPGHTVWPCVVPEPKSVKNRVHLDVHAAEAVVPGAALLSGVEEFGWTVLADPEGHEFCTFVRAQVPSYRLYELVVDCADHRRVGAWWGEVLGGRVDHDLEHGFTWVDQVPGMPFEGIVFTPVPEPKTVKNRVHWDVRLRPGVSVDDLVLGGATVLREPDDATRWWVLADPEGNEFCAFPGETAR